MNSPITPSPDNRELWAILIRLDTGGYLGFGGVTQAEHEVSELFAQQRQALLQQLEQAVPGKWIEFEGDKYQIGEPSTFYFEARGHDKAVDEFADILTKAREGKL